MARGARWIDLLDPTREELVTDAPVELHPRALDRLLARPEADHEPRPARNVRAARARGQEPRCRTCRGIVDVKPPTPAMYRYWRERFTPAEIRALGGAIWPHG